MWFVDTTIIGANLKYVHNYNTFKRHFKRLISLDDWKQNKHKPMIGLTQNGYTTKSF